MTNICIFVGFEIVRMTKTTILWVYQHYGIYDEHGYIIERKSRQQEMFSSLTHSVSK